MRWFVSILIILGVSSVACADLSLKHDNGVLSVDIDDGDVLVAIDCSIRIASGQGTIGSATGFALFGGACVQISEVVGSTDQDRRYCGAAIIEFNGEPIDGPSEVVQGMPVTNTSSSDDLVIEFYTYYYGTMLNGELFVPGVIDTITIPVPEPITFSLLALGGFLCSRRRKL